MHGFSDGTTTYTFVFHVTISWLSQNPSCSINCSHNCLIWRVVLTYWKGRTIASTSPEMNKTMQKIKSTPWYDVTSNCMEKAHEIKPPCVNPTAVKHWHTFILNPAHTVPYKILSTEFLFSYLGLKAENCDQKTNCYRDAQAHHHGLGVIETILKKRNRLNLPKNIFSYSKQKKVFYR